MGFWDSNFIRRFVPETGVKKISGNLVRFSLDIFGMSSEKKINYPKETKFVELQEKNFVLNNVIGKIAKTLSNAEFLDDNKNSKLLQKVNNPNEFQSKEEFLKEFGIYIISSGYTIVWKKYISAGNFDSMELINLNPDKTDLGTNNLKTEIFGKVETILLSDVIFFYDIKKNISDNKGYSRITPLRTQVNNIRISQIAKGIQIQNSGTTIVSPKVAANNGIIDEGLNTPILDNTSVRTQKDDIEDKLNNRDIENRIVVANKGLDVVNLSSQFNNVKFNEWVEPDILAIYDAFGFPIELSPYGKNATYENKDTAESSLIENEILPLANSFAQSLNSVFPDKGNIRASFDHLSSVSKTKSTVYTTQKTIVEMYLSLLEKGVIDSVKMNELLIEKGIL